MGHPNTPWCCFTIRRAVPWFSSASSMISIESAKANNIEPYSVSAGGVYQAATIENRGGHRGVVAVVFNPPDICIAAGGGIGHDISALTNRLRLKTAEFLAC